MNITEIVNKLQQKDKDLFLQAYTKWCNIIYNKSCDITNENLNIFIKDITDSTKLYIDESNELINDEGVALIHKRNDNQYRTHIYFDRYLNTVIDYEYERIN